MSIKINGTDVVDNNRKGIFQSANVGSFANPARPGSAAVGDLIWSTTDNQLQVWNGSSWVAAVGAGQLISASGGSDVFTGSSDGLKYHGFRSSSSFVVNSPSVTVEYVVVAGGGSGGRFLPPGSSAQGAIPVTSTYGGGGGAGGVLRGTVTFGPGTYTVTVGSGGAASPGTPSPGGNSSFTYPGGTITATGGGSAGWKSPLSADPTNLATYGPGNPGGSGGGSSGGYPQSASLSGGLAFRVKDPQEQGLLLHPEHLYRGRVGDGWRRARSISQVIVLEV